MSNNQNLVINQDQKEIFINFFNMLKRYIINNHLSEISALTNETVDQLYQRLLNKEITLPQDIGSYLARYEQLKEELTNNENNEITILNDDIEKIKDNLAELSWQDNENNEFSEEDRNAIEEISNLIGFDQDPEDEGLDNPIFQIISKIQIKIFEFKKKLFYKFYDYRNFDKNNFYLEINNMTSSNCTKNIELGALSYNLKNLI